MRLATLIKLRRTITSAQFIFLSFFTFLTAAVSAQVNSPYSRYGLGETVPQTNIVNRGMGGISAGYSDFMSVNFNNPASYSSFQSRLEPRSNLKVDGRVLLDVGVNFENQSLRNPNTTQKFSASNALFSYLQVGIPVRHNWGFSFGLRPLSRVGYKITERSRPPGLDSVLTEYTGDGGSYLPSIGTGVRFGNFSIGANLGFLFGKKELTMKRAFLNDSLSYFNANYTDRYSFGDLFFNAGLQYDIKITSQTSLRLGASGNLQQSLRGYHDVIRETFIRTADAGDRTLDSVQYETDIRGEVIYPSTLNVGFVIDHNKLNNGGGWLLGLDFVQNNWDDFRLFGMKEPVQNNWQIRAGGQIRPKARETYLSNVTYRLGFYTGPDYIAVDAERPSWGVSAGFGLPVPNYNRLSPGQYSLINLAIEYNKKGDNSNLLKENIFRISAGFTLSDLWFNKRRYD